MAQVVHKPEINADDFRKCGEISALLSEDKEEFYLNCGFCEFAFLRYNNFIQHIYEDHLSELPRSHVKHEAKSTSLHSRESPEYYGLENIVEVNLEADIERWEANEESRSTDFESNDFESDLLTANEAKDQEFPQDLNDERMHTNQTGIHSDDDDDDGDKYDVDSMVTDSELDQNKEKLHRNKTQKNSNHVGANDIDGTKEVLEAALDKKQNKSKPVAKEIKITDAILNVSQCIILAAIYKEYTCLWDENDIAYRFKNRRDEAFISVREDFNKKTGLHITEYDFEREILRLRKICSYEKKQKIKCKQKKLEHKTSCTYYDYIEYLEVDVAPFECSICGELYPALGKLKVHVASHDGSLPFKCIICGHGFQLGCNLTTHLRRHAQDYTYECEVCNKTFATSTDRKLHMRSHTGEKPFVCYICGANFSSSSHAFEHSLQHEKRRRYKCDICLKAFYSKRVLREHKKIHLKVREHICDICDKGFKSRKHLNQHKRIHDSEKRYVCKICGKRFAQSAGLCGHMKSHGTILATNVTDNLK